MARVLGEQLEQDKPKLAGLEHTTTATTAAASPAAPAIIVELKMKRAPAARTAAYCN